MLGRYAVLAPSNHLADDAHSLTQACQKQHLTW